MTAIYTLVAYRQNGEQSCRGHVTERSDSDFSIDVSDDIEEIVLLWARKVYADRTREKFSGVNEWEVTLLINGRDNGQYLSDAEGDVEYEVRTNISIKVYECVDTLITIARVKKEAELKAAAVALAAETERKRIEREVRELKEYERLHKKFNNPVKTLDAQVQELLSSDTYEFDDGA